MAAADWAPADACDLVGNNDQNCRTQDNTPSNSHATNRHRNDRNDASCGYQGTAFAPLLAVHARKFPRHHCSRGRNKDIEVRRTEIDEKKKKRREDDTRDESGPKHRERFLTGNGAKAPLAVTKGRDRGFKIGLRKIWPERVGEEQFGIRQLPQEKITNAQFA